MIEEDTFIKEQAKLAANNDQSEDDITRNSTSIHDAANNGVCKTMTEHMAAIFNYKLLPAGIRLEPVNSESEYLDTSTVIASSKTGKDNVVDWGKRIPTSRQM